MGYSTIIWLGLIIKQKPEGIKRRIILDLRRSGGNRKAQLPEKVVLPRPKDGVSMVRDNYNQRRSHHARKLVVIDINDAFMSLAVRECELPHTLAPEVQPEDFVLFCALLFGYKTAPLLWSRLAACLARLLQAMFRRSATPSILGRWAVGVARDAQRAQLHAGFDPGKDGGAWL